MNKKEFYFKLALLICTALCPIVCYLLVGYQDSYSKYFLTNAQPIFIISNVVTAYYLHKIKDWEIPALLIILVLTFSVDKYPIVHNVLAVLFFIKCLIIIYEKSRYRNIIYFYLMSLILLPISLFYVEVVLIYILCIYHAINLFRYKNLKECQKKRN